MRTKLTKSFLQALEPPHAGKRLTIYDTDVPKLAIRITSTGSMTWYVIKRVGGEMVWLKLGTFPDMSVDNARTEAQKVLSEFVQDRNPAAVKRATKAELTFAELFKLYGERHGKNKLSWKDDQQRFATYLEKPLGKAKITSIDRQSIANVIADAHKAGKSAGTQRQIRAVISSVLGKAVEWGLLDVNMAHGVKVTGKSVSRERFLLEKEIPAFFAALQEEKNTLMRDAIALSLLTGARRGNLVSMAWEDVDLKAKTWRIKRTKNSTPQVVMLSSEALKVLAIRNKATGGIGYVFPAETDTGHIYDTASTLARVLSNAGMKYGRKADGGMTPHDLRRSLGSWQAMTGSSLSVIGRSLNQKSLAATQVYARLEDSAVRESVDKATSRIIEIATKKKGAK